MDDETRIPTALWVDAALAQLTATGVPYYIHQRGAYAGGMVLLYLNGREQGGKLLTQQRDIEGILRWMPALREESIDEKEANAYIARAKLRDPDLWVIEIEDRTMVNPFLT